MPRSRYRVMDCKFPHFMTATINNWLPVFTRPETMEIVLNSWRFLQQHSGFEIFGYVVLENHLHLVARSPDLAQDIQRFKSYTAREIVALLEAERVVRLLSLLQYSKRSYKSDSTYQVWEEGSLPEIIISEAVLKQKLDYIHQNPVKRGYVDCAEHWRYSSARNYAGLRGLLEVRMGW